MKIIFFKIYQWFLPNSLSQKNAALHVMYFLSLFLTMNIVSAYWILTNLTGYDLSIFSGDFGNVIVLILPFLMCLVIYTLFIKKDKYILLFKQVQRNHVHVLGFSPKTLTILYLFLSIILFIAGLILTTSKHHLSAVSQ